MAALVHIDPQGKTPIYKQLLRQIERAVRTGALAPGDMLPSMNDLSQETGISKETVKKTYGILAGRGLIVPRQGKGFYVADAHALDAHLNILVLFDKFSIYKQIMFNALSDALGSRANLTVLSHQQSLDLFEYYLDTNLDEFDYYLIAPHFPLDAASQARARKLLSRVPNRKLIMVDHWLRDYPGHYGVVYQDFENDVYQGLSEGLDKLRRTDVLKVITLPTSLYGARIRQGIERFCSDYEIPVDFLCEPPSVIFRGETYLILNSQLDWGLSDLARKIKSQALQIGKDVNIIAYNDVDLNEVVLDGLTTISTDFPGMGKTVASMILNHRFEKVHCDFRMTRRSTF